MVIQTDGGNGDPVSVNTSIAKPAPASRVLRGPDGRWLPGTQCPSSGERRDVAERIRRRVLDAIQNATGDARLEHVLERVARTKPLEYLRLVISFIATDKATTKAKVAGGLTLEAMLSDLERRRAAVEARDAKIIDSKDAGGM